jgi:hypothetical protein
MKKLLTLLLLLGIKFSYAQTTDSLKWMNISPEVGNSIEQSEKIKFHLFLQYKDSLFESAHFIQLNDTTVELIIKPLNRPEISQITSIREEQEIAATIRNQVASHQESIYEPTLKEIRKKERQREFGEAMADIGTRILTEVIFIGIETLLLSALSN